MSSLEVVTDKTIFRTAGTITMGANLKEYLESSISHLNIADVGVYTHTQIDGHIADTTKHFTEASISHLNIQDVGVNSHIAIDSHLANTSNPHSVTASQVGADPAGTASAAISDHVALTDPHAQYVQVAGDTMTGDLITPSVIQTNGGTITRAGGLISSVALTGGRTLTVARNSDNTIATINDGTRTWTFNRTSGTITDWTVV